MPDEPSQHLPENDDTGEASELEVLEARSLVALHETYAHAREQCEHYRSYPVATVESFEDFEALPILTRDVVARDIRAVCSPAVEPTIFHTTSGTSTGEHLVIPRTESELAAHGAYLRHVYGLEGAAPRSITLRLMAAGRMKTKGLASPYVMQAAYHSEMGNDTGADLWDFIIQQLHLQFPWKGEWLRIGAIHSTPDRGLILLTRYMLARAIDPAASGVKDLVITGSWVGSHTRRWLAESWRADLVLPFSCSEMVGSADECPLAPRRYHFNDALHPEVVSAETGRPVAVGEQGRLILTGIHPYHECCMLLRYAVGDWARWLGPMACECGIVARTIEHLGRERGIATVDLGGDRRLQIPTVDLWEALDRVSAVPRLPQRRKARLAVTQTEPRPRLELVAEIYGPGSAAWRAEVEREIHDRMLEVRPDLAAAVSEGACELVVRSLPRGYA